MWEKDDYDEEERPPDPAQEKAEEELRQFFLANKEAVFFSRQVAVRFEDKYFHWVTNRAICNLIELNELQTETRELSTGGSIKLLWKRGYRYYKRSATEVVKLVEEYSNPNMTAALGYHGELMVLEGFARNHFVLLGRGLRQLGELIWTQTEHDMDFIFERDSVRYGVEVKNTLGYMEQEELNIKINLCKSLGIRPVFVVRMAPKNWIHEVSKAGGFILILKYQLYPFTHIHLARKVASTLSLPVDAPRTLLDRTMNRFLFYHRSNYVN
ncbi:hypothetical protein IQ264_00755 [Phormidium sp. LEGE 05292]|uniref:hypothetical protein n=1 Tax=[Phormidium] sp. LEGE 05292 TaxID=767427 RepID=UPI0018829E37|nr:hypothetical protein [Phormidium sp. LEGE 05292]MBE9224006.1 hypothetical protein [Phormidium sp. LEGE 05292]